MAKCSFCGKDATVFKGDISYCTEHFIEDNPDYRIPIIDETKKLAPKRFPDCQCPCHSKEGTGCYCACGEER